MAKNIPFDRVIKREPVVYNGEKFEYCNWLTEVTISPRVKTIKERSFYRCKSLEKITIPEGVKKVEDWAFSGCVNLKEVNLPESLEKIGFDAFENSKIESLYISKNLKEIANSSLENCKNLKHLEVNPENPYYTLHQGVLIDKRENCVVKCPNGDEFTKIEFPDTITNFDSDAFRNCKTLQTVTIRKGITNISELFFENCENLEEVNFPDTVSAIGRKAFYNCKKLSKFTIPSQVRNIEELAFYNCKSLEGVFIPASLTNFQASSLVGCDSLTKIEIDSANTNYYKVDVFLIAKKHLMQYRIQGNGCVYQHRDGPYSDVLIGFERNMTDVVIPENVTTIADQVFSESQITSVTLANSVELIAMYAFRNCHNLTSITIGDGLQQINSEAFVGCENLKEINISPNNQHFILEDGMLLSKDKTKLYFVLPKDEIAVPSTVEEISGGAFSACNSEDIKIILPEKFKCTSNIFKGAKNCTFIVYDAFKEFSLPDDCENLTIEVRHAGKSKNSQSRDYRFKNAKKVVLPNSINNIGSYAFNEQLQDVVIPDSVESIESNAFFYCNLSKLEIPDTVKTVENSALAGVKNVAVSNICDIQNVCIDLDTPISFDGTKGRIYTPSSTGDIVLHGVDSGVDTDVSRKRYEEHKYWFGEVKPGLQKAGLNFFYWDTSNYTFGARINDNMDAILDMATMPKSDDVVGFISTLANNINNTNLGFKIVDEIVSEKEVVETKIKAKVKKGPFVMVVSDEEKKENAKKEREASMNELFFKGVLYDYLEQNSDVKVSVCKVDKNGARLGVDYHGCFLFTLEIPTSIIDDGTSGDVIQNLLEEMDKYNVRCKLV